VHKELLEDWEHKVIREHREPRDLEDSQEHLFPHPQLVFGQMEMAPVPLFVLVFQT